MLIFFFLISKCQRYGKVESSVFNYMELAKHNLCDYVFFPRLDLMVKTSQFSSVLTLNILELFHNFIVLILSLKKSQNKLYRYENLLARNFQIYWGSWSLCYLNPLDLK